MKWVTLDLSTISQVMGKEVVGAGTVALDVVSWYSGRRRVMAIIVEDKESDFMVMMDRVPGIADDAYKLKAQGLGVKEIARRLAKEHGASAVVELRAWGVAYILVREYDGLERGR